MPIQMIGSTPRIARCSSMTNNAVLWLSCRVSQAMVWPLVSAVMPVLLG
jgi:hypothetical protein